MTRRIVVVDPRFPKLLADLRRQRGLSLRVLARLVVYSHTHLWEVETGRKRPTMPMAAALDKALSANGELAGLVAEHPEAVRPGPRRQPADSMNAGVADLHDAELLGAAEALRRRLEDLAHVAWSATSMAGATTQAAVVGTAAQWAQLASWLYDVFVRRRPRLMRLGPYRYSRRLRMETGASPYRIEVSKQGRTPRGECRSVTWQPPPPDIARRLHLGRDTSTIVRRENWYYADNEPVQVGVTYLPTAVAGSSCIATERTLGPGGLYSRLEDLGYQISRIHEEIFARLPTPDEAADLNVPPGVPVLEVVHTSYNSDRQPFEVTRFIIRGDLVGLDYEMPVED